MKKKILDEAHLEIYISGFGHVRKENRFWGQ